MKKSKKLIIGNWKMNPPSVAEAKKLAAGIKKGLRTVKKTQTVICPPFVYIPLLTGIPNTNVFLGAQNAFFESVGSYTGEVSFYTLPQFKVGFVIIGHSERRARGESEEDIHKKVRSVVGEGMTAVLCVGERERDAEGNYLSVIKDQITSGLQDISKKSLDHVVIAYEPVWAIGAKEAMTPRDVHETSIYIKKILRDMYGTLGDDVRILYGGSVDTGNAAMIISEGNVSGLLVGRASLKAADFLEIIQGVDQL